MNVNMQNIRSLKYKMKYKLSVRDKSSMASPMTAGAHSRLQYGTAILMFQAYGQVQRRSIAHSPSTLTQPPSLHTTRCAVRLPLRPPTLQTHVSNGPTTPSDARSRRLVCCSALGPNTLDHRLQLLDSWHVRGPTAATK